MTEKQKMLLRRLFDIGAFKTAPRGAGFTLARTDEPPSPFYIDLRTTDNPKSGPLTPQDVHYIAHELVLTAQKHDLIYKHVVGVPYAGEPFAKEFSRLTEASLLILEKNGLGDPHRVTRMCHGEYSAGETVLLVDDVITKADRKKEAISALEASGLPVLDVLVFIDREQGGVAELQEEGIEVRATHKISQVLDFYLRDWSLDLEAYGEIKEYLSTQRE